MDSICQCAEESGDHLAPRAASFELFYLAFALTVVKVVLGQALLDEASFVLAGLRV